MNELVIEKLHREVSALINALSPFIGQEEMQARYGVSGQTLLAMERRGDIPYRIRGRWVRVDVLQHELTSITQ